jgi:hypothetical protein
MALLLAVAVAVVVQTYTLQMKAHRQPSLPRQAAMQSLLVIPLKLGATMALLLAFIRGQGKVALWVFLETLKAFRQ